MQVDAGSPAGFILYQTAPIRIYPAQNVAKSTGGPDLAQYVPASHAGVSPLLFYALWGIFQLKFSRTNIYFFDKMLIVFALFSL